MSESAHLRVPAALRAAIAADAVPVRALRPPVQRALWMLPLAVPLVLSGPTVFNWRDVDALGPVWSWGMSVTQVLAGLALVAAALREAIPGRAWSPRALVMWAAVPIALIVLATYGSWAADPVAPRAWWLVLALCAASSTAIAMPAVATAAVLAVRAYPTRPGICGALAGLGSGMIADAGWRLFCHYSEPAHVMTAHLGGVSLATIAGVALVRWMHGSRPR